ncbi:MAG: ComF family protein [Phycisphaeraceae bacterium]|nr:ComF family protein [Phycisphaeraceae bacterium]
MAADPPNAHNRIGTALLEIERTWLGFTSPPLSSRLRDAGWNPEPLAASCSRCGASRGPNTAASDGCTECLDARLPWKRFVRLGTYHGVLGEVARDIKFNRFRSLGVAAGRLLGEQLKQAMEESRLDPNTVWIVPVPMSRLRYLERGIDHTLAITRGAAAVTGARCVRLLTRRHGPTQLAVVPSERAGNVRGVFRVRERGLRGDLPKVIVVMDDVRTSGATLVSACRTIRKSLSRNTLGERRRPDLWGMSLAVSDRASSS